jgi:hypothetical protein
MAGREAPVEPSDEANRETGLWSELPDPTSALGNGSPGGSRTSSTRKATFSLDWEHG